MVFLILISMIGTMDMYMFHFIAAIDERRWPSGDYSILMSKYGCPDHDINDLKHGYINV